MEIVIGYAVLALVFLTLSSGFVKPKRWHDLPENHVKLLRIGCLVGFLLIAAHLAARLL